MNTGTQRTPAGGWRFASAYGAGVWCALSLWAVANPHVFSGARESLAGLPSLAWVIFVCGFAAIVCLLGFRAGLDTGARRDRRPARDASSLFAFGFGLVFPVTAVLLTPVFSMLHAALLPALAWAFVGSMIAAWLFGRIARSGG